MNKVGSAISIAAAAAISLLLLGGAVVDHTSWLLVVWYAGLSVLTMLMYGLDKRAAIHQRWRTPESTLHSMALIGGWPGAVAAQILFRHKTRKISFRTIFWLTALLNTALCLWLHLVEAPAPLRPIQHWLGLPSIQF